MWMDLLNTPEYILITELFLLTHANIQKRLAEKSRNLWTAEHNPLWIHLESSVWGKGVTLKIYKWLLYEM